MSTTSALQCLGRKKSKALMVRVDVLLDQLAEDDGSAALWVGAEWACEHVEAVAKAMMEFRAALGSTASAVIVSTVTALLEALELVVASHVDTAEALWAALQSSSDHEAVVSVLEHGLAAEGDGAVDAGGGVLCERMVGYVAGGAYVVCVLWIGACLGGVV